MAFIKEFFKKLSSSQVNCAKRKTERHWKEKGATQLKGNRKKVLIKIYLSIYKIRIYIHMYMYVCIYILSYIYMKIRKSNTIVKVIENVPMERRAEMDHHKVGEIQ